MPDTAISPPRPSSPPDDRHEFGLCLSLLTSPARWQGNRLCRYALLFRGLIMLVAGVLVSTAQAQQRLSAEQFSLADYHGRVVYLDFWASWCTPCRASFPFMAELALTHGEALAIVAINVDEQAADAERFLQQFEAPFDIVFDPTGSLAAEHDIRGMPSSFLFDHEGRLIGQHIGFRRDDRHELQEWIARAVSNLEPGAINAR